MLKSKLFAKKIITVALVSAASAVTTITHAGDEAATTTIEETVVTGTKLEKSPTELTQSVTVITADTIKSRGYSDFTEVLRAVPGVEFKQAGGPGQFNYIKLRGFSASNILFVLDGVILNKGSSGDVGHLIGQLDPSVIEKVEVLRGPQAALYGSNSTAGVIAITTKSGSTRDINVGVEAGSLGWMKGHANINDSIALGAGKIQYALNASKTDSDGVHKYEFFKDRTTQAKVGYVSDIIDVGINYFKTDNEFGYAEPDQVNDILPSRNQYWSFQTPDPDQSSTTENEVRSAYVTHRITKNWKQSLRTSWMKKTYNTRDKDNGFLGKQTATVAGVTPTSKAGDELYIYDGFTGISPVKLDSQYYPFDVNLLYKDKSFQANYDVTYNSKALRVLLGMEHFEASAEKSGSYGNSEGESKHRSLYANGEYRVMDTGLVLASGLRINHHDSWGTQTTGSLGANFSFGQQSLFANIASSFKAPTLTNLHDPTYGDKDINPEQGKTVELGFRQTLAEDTFYWDITLWNTQLDNVIYFDLTPSIYRYNNGEKQRSYGTELSGYYRITDALTLNANYTFTHSKTKNSDGDWARTVQIAKHKTNLGFDYRWQRLTLSTNTYYSGPRLRWNNDVWMKAYTRTDVSARYGITDMLTIYARVENLFGEHIEEGLGYKQPGRYSLVGLDFSF